MPSGNVTLWPMPKTMTSRELVAYVVREVRLQRGWQQQKLATEAGVSPSLLARINRGDERVTRISLRYLEVALGLPDHLLWLIASDDRAGVAAVSEQDWPAGRLREYVLSEMTAGPDRRRRRGDVSA